jgi:hypothetical protein
MITADRMLVVDLGDANATRGFALGFEAGAFSQFSDTELEGHHGIWAANATMIELMTLDRGFEFDVIDSCQDKLLVLISKAHNARNKLLGAADGRKVHRIRELHAGDLGRRFGRPWLYLRSLKHCCQQAGAGRHPQNSPPS